MALSRDLCHGGCLNLEDYFVAGWIVGYSANLYSFDGQYFGFTDHVFQARRTNGACTVDWNIWLGVVWIGDELLELITNLNSELGIKLSLFYKF